MSPLCVVEFVKDFLIVVTITSKKTFYNAEMQFTNNEECQTMESLQRYAYTSC